MIPQDQAVRTILWLAIEDYSGLWEVLWQLNTDHPDSALSERVKVARQVVAELLEKELIKLYRYQEPNGEPIEVPKSEAIKVVFDPAMWEPPRQAGIAARISATRNGEEAYEALPK